MMMGPNMMGGFYGGGFIWMIFVYIFIAALIIGIIILIIWLVRRAGYSGKSIPTTNEAIVILKERYARGEIAKKNLKMLKKK